MLLCMQLIAQSNNIGQYDVRFANVDYSCQDLKASFDIQIKAHSADDHFFLTDQNYRFSFNPQAISNVQIDEMYLRTGNDPATGELYVYGEHTLTGSKAHIVSYNIENVFGRTYLNEEWLSIGRLSADIVNPSECMKLAFHDHAPENFPPTFIGSSYAYDGSLTAALEGTYTNQEPICCGSSDDLATETLTTGNPSPQDFNAISVSPNPFTDFTRFELDKNYSSIVLEVFNATGQSVYRERFKNQDNITFKRNDLSAGPYFFKLSQKGKTIEEGKLVITK